MHLTSATQEIQQARISEGFTMKSLFSHRSYLRCLTAAQRRSWFEQRKRLTPRVPIGTAVIPRSVRRQFAYITL
jgi:hypothetical protein